ncbi:MAG: type I-A CRISPR-associated protein Cas4/Csa1 [Candidatus Nitrosocaldus sp.]|nr:type I-A CRISPR-associated protein Cas4/Csa1 [Candidatus Nitrosocaldus sp.]
MAYFLDEEERKSIERLSREVDIDEEFRGWHYLDGPLRPPYNVTLPLYIVAGEMVFSSKREYEEYLINSRANPSREMLLGSSLHKAISTVVEEAKMFIYRYGLLSGSDLYHYLTKIRDGKVDELLSSIGKGRAGGGGGREEDHRTDIRQYVNRLWLYESLQVASSVDRVLAQGIESRDVLIQKAIPFTLEYEVDGRRIGLSERLRVDAFGHFMVVFELKTGKRSEHHRLATTGYALALESMLEHPINVGCIVYLSFEQDRTTPLIRREVHAIEESLRRWFIEERDRKMEILVH